MLGEDRFFDEFSLRFLSKCHSHAAWGSFWPYFSFVLQWFVQEMLMPLEVFAWNITPMQHGAHFFNDISTTGAYNTKPTIQTYNANLQYKHTIQTYNTKPAVQTCNTNLQCKPAIHTYNRNLQCKPTTQTSKQNLHRDMNQRRSRRGIEAGKLESVRSWLGRRDKGSIDKN